MTEYPNGGGSSGSGTTVLILGILGLVLGLVGLFPNGLCNMMAPVALVLGGAGAYLGNQAKMDETASDTDRSNANIGMILGLIGAICGLIGSLILLVYSGFCFMYCCCACAAGAGS